MLSDVYGDRMAAGNGGANMDSFPLQQKILVCSLLLLVKQQKAQEVTLGKVSVQIPQGLWGTFILQGAGLVLLMNSEGTSLETGVQQE